VMRGLSADEVVCCCTGFAAPTVYDKISLHRVKSPADGFSPEVEGFDWGKSRWKEPPVWHSAFWFPFFCQVSFPLSHWLGVTCIHYIPLVIQVNYCDRGKWYTFIGPISLPFGMEEIHGNPVGPLCQVESLSAQTSQRSGHRCNVGSPKASCTLFLKAHG
jgi:hypothetical protein